MLAVRYLSGPGLKSFILLVTYFAAQRPTDSEVSKITNLIFIYLYTENIKRLYIIFELFIVNI